MLLVATLKQTKAHRRGTGEQTWQNCPLRGRIAVSDAVGILTDGPLQLGGDGGCPDCWVWGLTLPCACDTSVTPPEVTAGHLTSQ